MTIESLGEFELDRTRIIGKGAWGEVYHGRQVSLNRPVAIKILKKEMTADKSFVERFQRESECLAKLVNEHIIQIYSAGQYKDSYFFAMELVKGLPLSAYVSGGRKFTMEEIAFVGESVSKALKSAWESAAKIVHRDIKPSNIMVACPGPEEEPDNASALDKDILSCEIKVMDFGLAKLTSADREATMAGTVIGTPKYISPEQGMGNPVDIRSDIYSLGIVLYEMISGQIPFEAESATSVIRHHIYDTAIAPSKHNPEVPLALETIVMKCIHKDPNQRYDSPNELLADLDAFRHGQALKYAVMVKAEGPAMDATIIAGTARPRKNRLMLYGAVTALVITGLIIYFLAINPLSKEKPAIAVKTLTQEEYSKLIARAKKSIEKEDADEALKALKAILPSRPDDIAAKELKRKIAVLFYNEGRINANNKKYMKAVAGYSKALELNPKQPRAYTYRSLAYFYLKDFDKTIVDCGKAIELDPRDTLAYFLRGLACQEKMKHDEAIKDYSIIITLQPEYTAAYLNRGISYNYKGEYGKAITDFKKVIAVKPGDDKLFMAYHHRGMAYENSGDYENARSDYRKALSISPNSDAVKKRLAVIENK